jgi:dTDP-4-dehydrorhamnose reductase
LNVYGRSKWEGETAVLSHAAALVFRTSWVYSLRSGSFVSKVLEWSRQQSRLRLVTDQISGPTWARMLAETTAQVIAMAVSHSEPLSWLTAHQGLYHLAGSGWTSRLQWGEAILRNDPRFEEQITTQIQPALTADFPTPARRPHFSALNCERFTKTFGICLPPWEESLQLAFDKAGF